MTRRNSNEPVGEPSDVPPHLTGDQISAINRFPDDNPNPVLRMDAQGLLIYANPASRPVRNAVATEIGDRLPSDVIARLEAVAAERGFVELDWDDRTYAIWPVPIPELDFTNLYGMDVTAERAIVKFPDQNPNPVFRIDHGGRLVYANPASRDIVTGLGVSPGEQLPEPLRADLLGRVETGDRSPVEIQVDHRTYAVVPVEVHGFGFIHVYGTDVTAVREIERLARENERLLLNILPEPIAHRLRNGEGLIADRFDDVTLLFADIVEFTQLSSAMPASELVGVLNDVFSAFDELVDRYQLEKVKTIGDAYMVVGGMTEQATDHTVRVARMALELTDAISRIEAARALGIAFRIGMHRGPVVAGVIGTKKFIYDLWGDTVNVASRMESLGIPGRVQVTGSVVEALGDAFTVESRGLIDVKGKGPTATWFLTGRTPGA